MRYATLEGGKRVRPLLCFGAGELASAAPERLEVAGCAVEMITCVFARARRPAVHG
jgi:farnesyl diphosphate synthase